MKTLWFIITAAAFLPVNANACTVCSTETGQQVRDGIVGDKLPIGVIATIAPWAAIAVISAAGLVLKGEKEPKIQ